MVPAEVDTGQLLDARYQRTNGHRATFAIFLSVEEAMRAAQRALTDSAPERVGFVVFDWTGSVAGVVRQGERK